MINRNLKITNDKALPPTRANILIAIHQIEMGNSMYGRAAALEIFKVRLNQDFGDFDSTVEAVCEWLGANTEPMVRNSRRNPATPLKTFLEPFMEPRVLYPHLAVAMQLLGHIVDYNEDHQYFRANWKWAPHLRTFRRRLDYQALRRSEKMADLAARANITTPPDH